MTKRLRLPVAISLVSGLFLSACLFGESPEKLNQMIDSGTPAKALTVLDEKLKNYPDDPAFNLLAIKARLALCLQRSCMAGTASDTIIVPEVLSGLPKLAAHVESPVTLSKDVSPLTVAGVFTGAMAQYQNAEPQPASVMVLYASAPKSVQPELAAGLFQPALSQARRGEMTNAANTLAAIGRNEDLPTTYTYSARMLAAMLAAQSNSNDANLVALRSLKTPPVPTAAAALLPWALLAQSTAASDTTPAGVLVSLPQLVANLKLGSVMDATATGAMAQELVAAGSNPTARTQWQRGWQGTPQQLQLTLQRMALVLDPNQPALWATYLPALVATTTAHPATSTTTVATDANLPDPTLPATQLSSASTPRVAAQVLRAANQLVNYPAVATPLVTFVSHLDLAKQQQIDLEKLSQALLIKAAEQNDVTSTVALAQTLPGVAQNNRQSVVPLLVRYIRTNLAEGNFNAATDTAAFLTNTLKMDVEFAPLVLEEFTDDLKRRKITDHLGADTPELLLQPSSTVALDLGPIFAFMQDYFADQPKVITAQLTTLVAQSSGAYGQPTTMYRLGSAFPEATLPEAKRNEWLNASLEQALLADAHLSGEQLAETSANLAIVHPGLNLAPLMEAALKRTPTLEEQRTLWQSATPQVKEVLRAIRPEFTLLMQGVDALSANQLDSAAQSLSGITEPNWKNEAAPFIEQFNDRLLSLSGIYVPVSASPALKTAAILLAPSGLTGGRLNMVSVTFVSRVGTLSEAESANLRTNAAAVHRFSLPVPFNFDARSIAITPQAVAQASNGGTFGTTYGNIRNLKLQGDDNPVLNVTLSDGSTTPFIRTLVDTSQPLRPDGTYLLQSRLGTTQPETQGILPPGSMLTLTTTDDTRARTQDDDTTSAFVYPLTGSLRHPASNQPIPLTGFYEPSTMTTTFTMSYPLPQSAQPARAAVRCQALAGPITCGAHNLNSARQAYAALVTGLQTRESLATTAGTRAALNSVSNVRLIKAATPAIIDVPAATATPTVSSTGGLLTSSTLHVSASTVTSSSSITVAISRTTITVSSPTTPASNLPQKAEADEEDTEAEEAAPLIKPSSSTEPEPGAFIDHSSSTGASVKTRTDSDEPEPGAFINHSGGHSAAAKTMATPPAAAAH